MFNRSPALLELLEAIVADEARAVGLVRASPELAHARAADERRIEGVTHQLYIGDTAPDSGARS